MSLTSITPARLAAGVLAVVAWSAPAAQAQFVPEALAPAARSSLACTNATPDASVVTWSANVRAYVGALDAGSRPVKVAALSEPVVCPRAATDASGAGAVAGTSIDDAEGLLIARRGTGGAFGPLARTGALGADPSVESVAIGGGLVAVGYRTKRDGRGIVLQRPGGTIAGRLRLPGRPSDKSDDGPFVGLDAAGRGLALWVDRERNNARLMAATFTAAAGLGPARALAEERVPDFVGFDIDVAVDPDGPAAVAWAVDEKTVVATGDTTSGPDLATAAATAIGDVVAVQADGAAIAAEAGILPTEVSIASRAAGRPFTPPRPLGGTTFLPALAVAIDRGRTAVFFERGGTTLGLLRLAALSGTAGDVSGRPRPLPVASVELPFEGLVAALPGGAPAMLTQVQYDTAGTSGGSLLQPVVYRPGGRFRRAKASVRVAPAQRLGRPASLRLRVRCARACGMRVIGVGSASRRVVDTARRLPGGRALLVRAPYRTEGARDVRRVRLEIGITDARGELRLRRRVSVRR